MGWRAKLQENYSNFSEFEAYSSNYGIASRLGYKTAKGAWRANPLIEGSVIPEDLRRIE